MKTTLNLNGIRRHVGNRYSCDGKPAELSAIVMLLIERVIELEGDQYAMIGALQGLGMDRCDTTQEWHHKRELIMAGDRCQSVGAFDPDHFYNENDDDSKETRDRLAMVLQQINTKGWRNELLPRLPRNALGVIEEPWLSAKKRSELGAA